MGGGEETCSRALGSRFYDWLHKPNHLESRGLNKWILFWDIDITLIYTQLQTVQNTDTRMGARARSQGPQYLLNILSECSLHKKLIILYLLHPPASQAKYLGQGLVRAKSASLVKHRWSRRPPVIACSWCGDVQHVIIHWVVRGRLSIFARKHWTVIYNILLSFSSRPLLFGSHTPACAGKHFSS